MKALIFALALIAIIPLTVAAHDSHDILLEFRGAIGVDPVSGLSAVTISTSPLIIVNSAVSNVVRGVAPGGVPWRIHDFRAEVKVDGSIHIEGSGLILAGGQGIGTAPALNIFATLFCGAATSPTASVSDSVPLAADGDFTIDGDLSPVPPDPCTTPVLLIEAAVTGGDHWFAAGIPAENN
jgi:hypothetical protein